MGRLLQLTAKIIVSCNKSCTLLGLNDSKGTRAGLRAYQTDIYDERQQQVYDVETLCTVATLRTDLGERTLLGQRALVGLSEHLFEGVPHCSVGPLL